jgi:DNA-binding MarR family transcriptional regulator
MIDITLTPKGAETFTSIRQSAYAHERIALEGLPPETLDLFRETLRRIESNIDIYD